MRNDEQNNREDEQNTERRRRGEGGGEQGKGKDGLVEMITDAIVDRHDYSVLCF